MLKALKTSLLTLIMLFFTEFVAGQSIDTVFNKVSQYAITGYELFKAKYLMARLRDPNEDDTTRDYAAMGIGNYWNKIYQNDSLKAEISRQLHKSIKEEKEKTPNSILSLFFLFGGNHDFLVENLGNKLKNHPFELEFLESYPHRKYVKYRLKQILKTTKPLEDGGMSEYIEIGFQLIALCEKKGWDMVIPLLNQENYSCNQCRHNLFRRMESKLGAVMNHAFDYSAQNYAPEFEIVAKSVIAWWGKNKDTANPCPKPKKYPEIY